VCRPNNITTRVESKKTSFETNIRKFLHVACNLPFEFQGLGHIKSDSCVTSHCYRHAKRKHCQSSRRARRSLSLSPVSFSRRIRSGAEAMDYRRAYGNSGRAYDAQNRRHSAHNRRQSEGIALRVEAQRHQPSRPSGARKKEGVFGRRPRGAAVYDWSLRDLRGGGAGKSTERCMPVVSRRPG